MNDKNESIELSVLEELRQETLARLSKPVEKSQSPEPVKLEVPETPKIPSAPAKPEQEQINQLKASAEAGDVYAQSDLGWRYAKDEGVEQNWIQAAHWFRKAADQGDVEAKKALDRLL